MDIRIKIKFFSQHTDFFLLSVYFPSNHDLNSHLQLIDDFLSQNIDTPDIVSGDFNSSHTLWNSTFDTPRL